MKKRSVKKFNKFFKEHILIITLVAVFFLVKFVYLFKFHNVIWDEAVYLGMGKYIYSLGKIGFWEIVRPVGLPLIIGLFWKLNLNYIFLSELLTLFFSIGCMILTYLIGRESFNKIIGFFAAFFMAITSIFFLYANYILTGISSTFFILLGIYFYVKKNNLMLAGIFSAIGALFRFPQGMILLCFILLFFINNLLKKNKFSNTIKQSFIYVSSFVLTHIPFMIFNYIIYNKETSRLYHALFRPWILAAWAQSNPAESVITGTFGSYVYNILFYAINMLKENTLLIFLFFGIVFFIRSKEFSDHKKNIIFIAFLLYFTYFTYISNKQTRFLLVFLPYICILASYGFYQLFKFAKTKDRYRVLIILFFLISVYGVASRDVEYYRWRLPSENEITAKYYKFFTNREIEGPILTTDPVHAAYADAKFIPFYFSVDTAWKIYSQNRNSSYAIIYSPESFFCAKGDLGCEKKLDKMTKTIEKENSLIFSKIYLDKVYYIYEVI